MKTCLLLLACISACLGLASAQTARRPAALHSNNSSVNDSVFIRKIYDQELTQGKVFERLSSLCKDVGPRLSGSVGAARAVEWAEKEMHTARFDTVYRQEVMVPHWERGEELAYFNEGATSRRIALSICALGGSVPTPANRLSAEVIEVQSFDELKAKGTAIVGKIVFFNRAFDQRYYNTGDAYGAAIDQRISGASEAAKQGAAGVIIRSMTGIIDDYPHTGMLRYQQTAAKVPACAVSTQGATVLSAALKRTPALRLTVTLGCKQYSDERSYNVVAETRGSDSKDIILVGGHLDSWDLAQGAHDDGAGVTQSLEALELLQRGGYKPRRTLRCVFFMNEESGARGAAAYASEAKKRGEHHLVAIESDEGGFAPRGFNINTTRKRYEEMLRWEALFKPYGSGWFKQAEEGGTDIEPLRGFAEALIGLMPDTQRYFDIHHTAKDKIDAVNERELKLGAASLASLLYLTDKYGL